MSEELLKKIFDDIENNKKTIAAQTVLIEKLTNEVISLKNTTFYEQPKKQTETEILEKQILKGFGIANLDN